MHLLSSVSRSAPPRVILPPALPCPKIRASSVSHPRFPLPNLMEKISVKAARQAAAIGHNVLVQGWIRTRRDSKGGFSFLEVNDGSSLANLQVIADGSLPNYETEVKHLTAGCSVADRRRGESLRRQRAGDRSRSPKSSPSSARPIPKPIRCKKSSTRSKSSANGPTCGRGPTPSARSRASATASAAASTTSFRKTASSTSTRRSSRPATAKGPGRCSASRRSTSKSCRATARKINHALDFFGKPDLPHRQRPARRRNLRLLARQDLHLRADVPRREQQHLAAPRRVLDGRAGDGVLRSDRQHGPRRAVPQANLQGRARAVPRRHGLLQRALRQDDDRDAAKDRRQRLPPPALHRGRRDSAKSAARNSSSR